MKTSTRQQEGGNSKKHQLLRFVLCALLFALSLPAEAHQPKKVPRIGILEPATAISNSARIEAFRQGLREHGYTEGKNIAIEYRYADGKNERITALAAELVNLKVDLIVTSQTPTVFAIKKVSSTMPIVFFMLSFPVENGIVASFAHPGGNATGQIGDFLGEVGVGFILYPVLVPALTLCGGVHGQGADSTIGCITQLLIVGLVASWAIIGWRVVLSKGWKWARRNRALKA